MKKYIPFDLVVGYFFVIAITMVCQSFTLKATTNQEFPKKENIDKSPTVKGVPTHLNLTILPVQQTPDIQAPAVAKTDSLDFEVKVIRPRKFLLSFYKKQANDIFIKIYDVLGNLVHQEKVSKKGRFKKEYDLSAYKTELYVIEVSDSNTTKAKRVFMG